VCVKNVTWDWTQVHITYNNVLSLTEVIFKPLNNNVLTDRSLVWNSTLGINQVHYNQYIYLQS